MTISNGHNLPSDRLTRPAPPMYGLNTSFGIPNGVYPQIYRGALSGDHDAAVKQLAAFLTIVHDLRLPGVVFHGFPHELAEHWDSLAQLAADHGVLCGASWGVDSNDLTPEQKGDLIAEVLVKGTCEFGLIDAEGAWETVTGPDDRTTPGAATAMCEQIRKHAPHAVLGDQSWFAIESHQAFPDSKFAEHMTFRAPQFYCNDMRGATRCKRVHDWMERDWATHEHWLLTAKGPSFVRPRTVTIQGYGWSDILPDLDQLLEAYSDKPVIMWAEPLPKDDVMAALRKWAGA